MIERWNRDQVLALAPDASSQKAAQGVSSPGKWSNAGVAAEAVWGECKGSGSKPYRACVDLSEPAYRCSCPSRKFPCKHALGLLLLWSADGVPGADEPADWVAEWLDQRRARAAKPAAAPRTAEPGAAPDPRRAEQREQRVAAGLAELERWLADQMRQGIAGSRRHDHWDGLVKRLVDAQAPGVAGTVSRLGAVLSDDDWPARLLSEYSLLHLLLTAHRREALTPTVRGRVGFPVTKEEVLSGETVRDVWDVLGRRDEEQDRLISRRVWLRGRATGRAALVLSFAPTGQALDASLVTGTALDAELAFYPGTAPLRALVATRHAAAPAAPPPGSPPEAVLEEVAAALAGDPWTDSWPVVLDAVTPMRNGSWLLGGPSGGLPLHPSAGTPWRLVAASGGHPLTVAAEWTPWGLRPLSTWDEEGRVVVL
ncbi:SWIM zinc finger family protein [Planomonospora sp. ID67723]|uniref:SWIM zinc finger family protein n=1 Tax=Planomonospora sp. ID67723 TaxID=2738134 RepID=UPI0018C3E891|nr:SWIM zinc finger family protein [Planomonospora sp. ID67723]MBG0830995.1 SWIM zinc finger family protein [Planomonospora sp. ID67723]